MIKKKEKTNKKKSSNIFPGWTAIQKTRDKMKTQCKPHGEVGERREQVPGHPGVPEGGLSPALGPPKTRLPQCSCERCCSCAGMELPHSEGSACFGHRVQSLVSGADTSPPGSDVPGQTDLQTAEEHGSSEPGMCQFSFPLPHLDYFSVVIENFSKITV